VRSQRIAAIATAGATVLAVPVGYEVAHPQPAAISRPAALAPSSRAATPGRSATGPSIPDSVALSAADLPRDVKLNLDLTSSDQPLVSGQECKARAGAVGPRPVAGRQWSWDDRSGGITGTRVDLIITDWRGGAGEQVFDELETDNGYCRWSQPVKYREFTAPLGDDSYSCTSTKAVLNYGRSVVRLGNVIAGVEVQQAGGTAEAVSTAEELAIKVSERLQVSGLPATSA
jgi:hypothetical protein